jgi:hypothetical protein
MKYYTLTGTLAISQLIHSVSAQLDQALFVDVNTTDLAAIPRDTFTLAPTHQVTFMNIDENQRESLMSIINSRIEMEANRDFGQLNRMAFWQSVLGYVNTPESNDINSIHQIPLAESMDWFDVNVRRHGCYCWPDENHGDTIFGFGQPMDNLDNNCFDLWHCYRCVSQMNHCRNVDWVNHHYSCAFANKENGKYIDFLCSDAPGSCGKLLCECDAMFARKVRQGVEEYNKLPNPSIKNAFPDSCSRKNGFEKHAAENKQCCGFWPPVGKVRVYPTETSCCGANGNPYLLNTDGARDHCVKEGEVEETTADLVAEATYEGIKIHGDDEEAREQGAMEWVSGNHNKNPNQVKKDDQILNHNVTFNAQHEDFHAEFPNASEEEHQNFHNKMNLNHEGQVILAQMEAHDQAEIQAAEAESHQLELEFQQEARSARYPKPAAPAAPVVTEAPTTIEPTTEELPMTTEEAEPDSIQNIVKEHKAYHDSHPDEPANSEGHTAKHKELDARMSNLFG